MSKQQTAVEWLIEQLQKTRDWQRVINEANQSGSSVRDGIKEAKEMEKQQIIDACWAGGDDGEQYYKETYGGNK
jgi:hypothetical protein